jgi:hypothetical protein
MNDLSALDAPLAILTASAGLRPSARTSMIPVVSVTVTWMSAFTSSMLRSSSFSSFFTCDAMDGVFATAE